MSIRIHDRIREILQTTPGLTQRGLAERMALNPAAINRMLYGRRNIMAEEIPVIESYLGQKLDLHAQHARDYQLYKRSKAQGDGGAAPQDPEAMAPVPVYALAARAARDANAPREAIDWVPRHPAQLGLRDAFAFYVPGDDMAPRYFKGELVYIHPRRPAEPGRDCLVEMEDGTQVLRRLISQQGGKLRLRAFNPLKDAEIADKKIRGLYLVVGRG